MLFAFKCVKLPYQLSKGDAQSEKQICLKLNFKKKLPFSRALYDQKVINNLANKIEHQACPQSITGAL